MKIRMKSQVSGTRNGVKWPSAGEKIEVSDEEGAALCRGGLAEPVTEDRVEKAVAPEPEERHVCDVCGQEAKTKAGLAAHKRSHDDDES